MTVERRVAPARILYTSTTGTRAPGFVMASSLQAAREQLEQAGHREIRFWSHPHFGDAPGASPELAYAIAPRPSTSKARALAIGVWTSPVVLVSLMLADGAMLHEAASVAFLAHTWTLATALPSMREMVRLREYRVASVLVRRVAMEVVDALVAVELHEEGAAHAVLRAQARFTEATKGQAPGFIPLFQCAIARARAQRGELAAAEDALGRVAAELLWVGEERLLDVTARDLALARAAFAGGG